VFVSGAELEEDARFRADYRLVVADFGPLPTRSGKLQELVGNLWVRTTGACGVRTDGATTAIPAWLFGAFQLRTPVIRRYQQAPADPAAAEAHARQLAELTTWLQHPPCVGVFHADGRASARIGERTTQLRLPLAAGRWRALVVPADPALTVHCAGSAAGGTAGEFVLAEDGEQELQLRIADGAALPVQVERVDLVRVDR
jgi:hypothetical protein